MSVMSRYVYDTTAVFDKAVKRIRKKPEIKKRLFRKIDEILENPLPDQYKHLQHNLKNCCRVHIGSFVLTFEILEKEQIVIFHDFDHHDTIYS